MWFPEGRRIPDGGRPVPGGAAVCDLMPRQSHNRPSAGERQIDMSYRERLSTEFIKWVMEEKGERERRGERKRKRGRQGGEEAAANSSEEGQKEG